MPSGWLTVFCLFLPSFRWCEGDDPVPLVGVVFVWPLLLAGSVIAHAAAAATEQMRRRRGRRLLHFVRMSVLCPTALIVYMLVTKRSAGGGLLVAALVAVAMTVLVFWATRRAPTALAVAIVSLCVATSHLAFCSILVASSRSWGATPWGARVSVAVACALFAGTLWWTGEAAHARRRREISACE